MQFKQSEKVHVVFGTDGRYDVRFGRRCIGLSTTNVYKFTYAVTLGNGSWHYRRSCMLHAVTWTISC